MIFSNKHTRLGTLLCRIGVIALLLAMLAGVLTSCGNRAAAIPKLKHDSKAFDNLDADKEGLKKDELKLLAMSIDNMDKAADQYELRQQLVAALRGYDMTVEGFDDNNLPAPQPEMVADFAIHVLSAHDIDAYDHMTAEDVQLLVDAYKTSVATEEKIGFLTRILTWVAMAFEWMINVLGFGNFMLGTFFFAIVVEIIMLPLAIHQQKNARKQARLRPKEMAIRKKYAGRNDQKTAQEMQGEIQQMYQNEGINQLSSGCLPLLISMPVIFALYYIVIDPMKYMMSCPAELASALNTFATAPHAAGGLGLSLNSTRGTIEILSHLRELGGICPPEFAEFQFFSNSEACYETLSHILTSHTIPTFSVFGVNFGLTPSMTPSWLWLVPVLTFVVYFGSMKLNRKLTYQPVSASDPAMGCSNTIMDVSMPLMSTVFTFMVPGAVGVYWMFKSIVGTVKQFIMNKVMPLPKFTDADYKAAEKELAAKEKGRPAKKPSGTRNPNVRSLHHIDDEDYETSSPTAPKKPAVSETEEHQAPEADASQTDANQETHRPTLIGGAPLKEERPEQDRARRKKKKKDAAQGDTSDSSEVQDNSNVQDSSNDQTSTEDAADTSDTPDSSHHS